MIDHTGNIETGEDENTPSTPTPTQTDPLHLGEQSTEAFDFQDERTSPRYADQQAEDLNSDFDNFFEISATDSVIEEPTESSEYEDEIDENSQEILEEEVGGDDELSASDFEDSMNSLSGEPDKKPVDISDFANSEESNLDNGEYLYDVQLSRIDSKDLRETLKSVLMDEKLKLNHGEFVKQIKDGRVTIPDLNPVKAKRIIEQLHYTDIDIRWVQKRVTMETGAESESKSLAPKDHPRETDV